MTPGEKRAISDLTSSRDIEILVAHEPAEIDIVAFGLDANRKIADDRYTILFSNERSPEGALSYSKTDSATKLVIGLDRLPASIDRVTITATHDSLPLRSAQALSVQIGSAAHLDCKANLADEKALMLVDLYRHGGDWRIGAVVQGFSGGLADLVRHFGGEVEEAPAPSTAEPQALPSPSPAPVSLSKVDLRKNKVGVSLKKLGIENEQAEVSVIIDASGSMGHLYGDGTVQETVERIAPVALRLDHDGTMPTWFYASKCKRVEDLTANNLDGFVSRTCPSPGAKISSEPTSMKDIIDGSRRSTGASIGYGNDEPTVMNAILAQEPPHRTTPLLVIFITDGGITRSKAISEILQRASNRPIFWQFVGVGRANYGVLKKLDTLTGRIVDNAGFFSVDDLSQISDDELYDRILSEFPQWLKAARSHGILA
ncbi:VWA domain-containing protein [Novosphingobium profundi]|uniref:VWA domain-containing protein n=1 Tax=Novosphingobium profundi TaxID=1774954 RepID=UPI001FE45ADF|nr:VWA domain-containing protein [Novosphingobium profundi]